MNWKEFEKAWHQSKKFLAFLVMEMLLGGLTFYALFLLAHDRLSWMSVLILSALIFNMGFIAVAFNLEQAKLDRYSRFVSMFFTGASIQMKEKLDNVQKQTEFKCP